MPLIPVLFVRNRRKHRTIKIVSCQYQNDRKLCIGNTRYQFEIFLSFRAFNKHFETRCYLLGVQPHNKIHCKKTSVNVWLDSFVTTPKIRLIGSNNEKSIGMFAPPLPAKLIFQQQIHRFPVAKRVKTSRLPVTRSWSRHGNHHSLFDFLRRDRLVRILPHAMTLGIKIEKMFKRKIERRFRYKTSTAPSLNENGTIR